MFKFRVVHHVSKTDSLLERVTYQYLSTAISGKNRTNVIAS